MTYQRESTDYALKKTNAFALCQLGYMLKVRRQQRKGDQLFDRDLTMKHDEKAIAAVENLLADSTGRQDAAEGIGGERCKSATAIRPFMEKNGYSFTVFLANQTSVLLQYGVEGIPTKFLIDKSGRIQFKHVGGGPDLKVAEELSKEIDELLAAAD